MASFIPNFYARFRRRGLNIDFYFICRLYEIVDPCIAHALKKLLRVGRSHKSVEQDIQDAIDTLRRWQDLQREDAEDSQPMGATVQIASNGVKPRHCYHCGKGDLDVVPRGEAGLTFCAKCMPSVEAMIREQDSQVDTTFSIHYLAVHSQCESIDNSEWWIGPGWYCVASDPFTNMLMHEGGMLSFSVAQAWLADYIQTEKDNAPVEK